MTAGLLDCVGAAEYLGCSESLVRKLASQRRVASVKIGGKVKFRPGDLDAYIEARVRPAVDPRPSPRLRSVKRQVS